jgi:hypothetical protein
VAAVLIDAGADIEAPGASIGGGSPLNNAVAYGCWHVARLLVQRGAVVDSLWQAAALGMNDRVEELLNADPPPQEGLDEAFWQACHGGQLRTAQLLLARGADINASPAYGEGHAPLDIASGMDERRTQLVKWLTGHDAASATKPAAPVAKHLPQAKGGAHAGFAPCFPTTDLRAALAHYGQLGFTVMPYTTGAEWGWVRFEDAEIHFYLKQDHDPARTAAAADLTVVDCDALEREWSATGVPGTSDPYNTPYNTREATHIDPDNNLIRFGSPLESTA